MVSGTRFCECCSVFLGLDGVGDSFLGKNRIMGLNKSYCPSGCIFLLITERSKILKDKLENSNIIIFSCIQYYCVEGFYESAMSFSEAGVLFLLITK